VGQYYAALRLGIDWLKRRHEADAASQERIGVLDGLLERATRAMRAVVDSLHPRALDELGLPDAAQALVDEFRAHSGIEVDFARERAPVDLPRPRALMIYRALQEALTNVAKHAQATRVRIALELDDDDVVLSVADDGRGIEAQARDKRDSFGLFGIGQRAEILGGAMAIESSASGTRLIVRLPRDDRFGTGASSASVA
jgi:signal transduction histidine kinase